ncbi:MAG: serine/threonine-protein kinase [Candidatus Acidiferrum sp.]
MFCISCGSELPETARFCANCGKPIEHGDPDATVVGSHAAVTEANAETIAPDLSRTGPATPRRSGSQARPSALPSNPTLSSSDAIGGGRFPPGAIIGERYRIVALLGRGGMGEVYRAEDLRLSQVLAIKFLPEALSKDEAALARFHSEVRIARQVAHPNVCRVFDIGDADGVPFLTMEYVDGEDLSCLIRRIGRVPQDKAVEISRQICAGLAAAHERGVVHRDLKPANVMLDGAGKARITDFGLAGIAATMSGAEVRAGTPAYMAPEQLEGREVTIKSDIFSLGLVMYEVLTGRRAYDAANLQELMKSREGAITNPSSIVKDLDPLLERVILRCLEKDPTKRPASALQVAAALPGGDPLAAALAAGETPSPEMVAAAGATEGMPVKLALACFLTVLILVGVSIYLGFLESGLKQVHPQYSPEVLEHKAREMIAGFGYPARAKDSASGFTYDSDYLIYLDTKDKPGGNWNRVLAQRPPVLQFWFRQSPQELTASGFSNNSLTPGVVTSSDPPPIYSGMVDIRVDPAGRLLYFQAIPAEKEDQAATAKAPDWAPFFSAAGLSLADFQPASPHWNGLASADARAAWDGKWPGSNRPLHIEGAALHGLPVFFQLSGPWTVPWRMAPPPPTPSQLAFTIFGNSLTFFFICAGIWLARRNYSRGRGDRQGAWKVASVVLLLSLAIFCTKAHLKFSNDTLLLVLLALSTALLMAGLMWVLYVALEPYVRSRWPQTIISWSRALAGKLRDPLVGRDLLYGTIMGLAWVVVFFVGYLVNIHLGDRPKLPDLIESTRGALAIWLGRVIGGITSVLIFFFVLMFFRALVRNRWVAAALFVLLYSTFNTLSSNHPLVSAPVWIIVFGIAAFAMVRFGLVVLATAVFTADILLNVPYTLDFSAWYAPLSICMVLSIVALAGWGFYTALAGQKLLKEELFD